MILQTCPAVRDTDVKFHAKLYRLSDLSTHNRAHKWLADADNPVLNAVGMVVIHELLLLINLADCLQTLCLVNVQRFPLIQLFIYGGKVSFQIVQLFSNGFACHFCGVLAAADILQVFFSSALAVGTWLLTVGRAMEHIQHFFSVFSGFIQQGNILGISDIGRSAGSIYYHGTAISAIA